MDYRVVVHCFEGLAIGLTTCLIFLDCDCDSQAVVELPLPMVLVLAEVHRLAVILVGLVVDLTMCWTFCYSDLCYYDLCYYDLCY